MSVQDEYQRFLVWLSAGDYSDDVRRVAKIVGDNLDVVIPAPSNAGRRAVVLTPILRGALPGMDPVIDVQQPARGATLPWTRLQRLAVGPFRGFRYEEIFNFDRRVVLVYGPNGSGKSSLCEALEFGLLGFVEEAEAKRVATLPDYFRNIHDGRYAEPQLSSAGAGNGVPVAPAPELLRFALIEKNRIDGFARIAAHRPAQAEARIASLFGLEAFNTFVNNFTTNLESQLHLATPRAQELTERRALLAGALETLGGREESFGARNREEQDLAARFEAGATYERLLAHLGLAGADGRLQEVARQLDDELPTQSGLNVGRLRDSRREARAARRELTAQEARLAARVADVSYSELYKAVLALQPLSADACPACSTPIGQVAENPFERAARGLDALQELAELELSCEAARRQAAESEQNFRRQVQSVIEREPDEVAVPAEAQSGELLPQIWGRLVRTAMDAQNRDREIVALQHQRAALVTERNHLDELREEAIALEERRRLLQERVDAAQNRVDGFEEENADLVAQVAAEAVGLAAEDRIRVAYAAFIGAIEAYKDSLPETLLADLNDTTRDLYNDFNHDDHETDKLDRVVLPLRGGDRIQIAFRGAPGTLHDALHLLSEGHLRCLGLAILLAKNVSLDLPLIVFDDAVNAIDHDHRSGIRHILFSDVRLAAKQIIVTCHSNEFIKDIQQHLTEAESRLYVIRPHDGNHQPRVSGGKSRNYVVKARDALTQGDYRECLAACRRALENLSNRTWKKLGNDHDQGELVLNIRSPDSPPELKELVLKIDQRLRNLVGNGSLAGRWPQRSQAFQDIVAIPERTLAWSHLNKGTHDEEDREDFEAQLVERIVDAVDRLSLSFA